MQTKTYFTTSTFFTTYIDKARTITKTRTSVRSNIITETYSGGQFDYTPQQENDQSPTIEESPQEKYLSLGPNIYGLVKTLYTTYTYFNGIGIDSREVIAQESTSVFSTTFPLSPFQNWRFLIFFIQADLSSRKSELCDTKCRVD